MPAHVAAFFGQEGGSNIDDRAKVPSLSPQGKTWTISVDGNKTKLMRNLDGDLVPVNVLRVVVLGLRQAARPGLLRGCLRS
jgi:hypothetical protein